MVFSGTATASDNREPPLFQLRSQQLHKIFWSLPVHSVTVWESGIRVGACSEWREFREASDKRNHLLRSRGTVHSEREKGIRCKRVDQGFERLPGERSVTFIAESRRDHNGDLY